MADIQSAEVADLLTVESNNKDNGNYGSNMESDAEEDDDEDYFWDQLNV